MPQSLFVGLSSTAAAVCGSIQRITITTIDLFIAISIGCALSAVCLSFGLEESTILGLVYNT